VLVLMALMLLLTGAIVHRHRISQRPDA